MDQIKKILSYLGTNRDGFLVVIAILYALGFGGWAIYAWAAQLGTAPAFQAQYFVAGLPILVSAGVVIILGKLLKVFLTHYLTDWFKNRNRTTQVLLIIAFLAVVAITMLFLNFPPDYILSSRWKNISIIVAGTTFLSVGLTAAIVGASAYSGEDTSEAVIYSSLSYLAIFLCLILWPGVSPS